MDPIKITRKQALPILNATFPDYNGRKISIEFTDHVTFSDTIWADGSRNYYAFVKSSGQVVYLAVPATWMNPVEGKTVELPTNILVVEHAIFCGHDLGIRIYAHPVNAPKWLAA